LKVYYNEKMKKYYGSCHCEKVKFTVTTVIDRVVSCNCSICSKKGVLHHRVTPEQFSLLKGKNELSCYQFDSKEAKHYFCSNCGIHPFSNPRAAPEMYSINIRCLNNFNLENDNYKIVEFDGQNWEESVATLNKVLNTEI